MGVTFVTPTLIAGDRSLVDVVAHEISHSWAGNLVTNSTWEDFWLNEGFCMFIERKIISKINGEDSRHFSSLLGWNDLHDSVELFGKDSPLTSLVVNLNDTDPDDAFSSIPYEKGYNFLFYLEKCLGGPDVFEPYLKAHYEHFAYKSISSADWKEYLFKYFSSNEEKTNILKSIDWDTWMFSPGMPPTSMPFNLNLANVSKDLAKRYILSFI
jgi:leukotriene-A4 hydrolase